MLYHRLRVSPQAYQPLHAVPQAAGFSAGLSPAPHAVPQAAGFSVGLSAAPHAVPQAALVCALSCLFHPKMFANAILLTSCNMCIFRLSPRCIYRIARAERQKKYALFYYIGTFCNLWTDAAYHVTLLLMPTDCSVLRTPTSPLRFGPC